MCIRDRNKKFTLVDADLVKRDLLNALNIQQGSMVGIPWYGTTIWNYLFENQTVETESLIVSEIQRVCGQDPRIFVNQVQMYPQLNGILVAIELSIVPSTVPTLLNLFFNQSTGSASYVT